MSINVDPYLPIELEVSECRIEGQRTVEFGIKAWASAPFHQFEASTDRCEGGRVYELSWEQLLVLQDRISSQISALKPLIDAGKLATK